MKFLIAFFCLIATAETSYGADSKKTPIVGAFITRNTFSPDELNSDLATSSIKEQKSNFGFSIEASFPVANMFYAGLRVGQSQANSDSMTDGNTLHGSKINQDTAGFVLRVPVVHTDVLRVDAFSEIGFITKFKHEITDTSGVTEYNTGKKGSGEYQRVGASVGMGYKRAFLFVEAGTESNKYRGLEKTGSRTGNITNIDLSGTYTAVGLIFDASFVKSK